MLRHLDYIEYDEEYYRIIKNANHAYILLVNELDLLYSRNEPLAKLNEDPSTVAVWKRFDVIVGNEVAIHEFAQGFKNFLNTNNHSAQVERLAIIAGQNEATLTPSLEKLIKEADIAGAMAASYGYTRLPKSKTSGRGKRYIHSYKLEYKNDGSYCG